MAGWSQFTPSPDTRNVYVSAGGDDANDGLTEQTPKASIQSAYALLRTGFPDWLHVRRGDVFQGGLGDWARSGRSLDQPMVVTTYGNSTEQPLFLCGVGEGLTVHRAPIDFVAFTGLRFVADTHDGSNGQPYGISLLQPCSHVLIEDCKVERFFTNLRIQGARTHDVRLRRCVVVDAFTKTAGHAQGIYVDTIADLLIEECVFDHNGWNPSVPGADPTIFRHNIYIQGDVRNANVRGCIIARAGSHGLQARSGGDIRDNLFLSNPINLLVGSDIQNTGANHATVIGNVILDSRDIDATQPRGWATQFQCLVYGEIAYNVIAHRAAGTEPVAFHFDSNKGAGVVGLDFHHNVAHRWGAPLLLAGNRFMGLLLRSNDIQEDSGPLVLGAPADFLFGVHSVANRFWTGAPADQWMRQNGHAMSLEQWKSAFGDVSSSAVMVSYPRAHETIGDYAGPDWNGDPGSLESFLEQARQQSRFNWYEKFSGTVASARFRSNFAVGQWPP